MADPIVVEPQAAPTPEPKADFDAEAFAKQLTETVTAAVTEKMTEQFKSQIDGLNRKVTDQEKEKETLVETAKAEKMTVEEQLAALRADREADKREMTAKDTAATLREKQLSWKAEAVKRNLPDTTYVDPSLSLEDGVLYLDGFKTALDTSVTDGINKGLASGEKPGSGNTPESEPVVNMDGKSSAEKRTIYLADEQKKLEARQANIAGIATPAPGKT